MKSALQKKSSPFLEEPSDLCVQVAGGLSVIKRFWGEVQLYSLNFPLLIQTLLLKLFFYKQTWHLCCWPYIKFAHRLTLGLNSVVTCETSLRLLNINLMEYSMITHPFISLNDTVVILLTRNQLCASSYSDQCWSKWIQITGRHPGYVELIS